MILGARFMEFVVLAFSQQLPLRGPGLGFWIMFKLILDVLIAHGVLPRLVRLANIFFFQELVRIILDLFGQIVSEELCLGIRLRTVPLHDLRLEALLLVASVTIL